MRIAGNATLILPLHGELDRIREEAAGAAKIGTTGRGIGPAYEDKVGRRAIRVNDLADLSIHRPPRSNACLRITIALRRGLGQAKSRRRICSSSSARLRHISCHLFDAVWSLLDEVKREGKRILFEGAQGVLLDIDHGTYPYVTSSNTVAGQAAAGSGLGPQSIGYVLGIAKAYTTRVGSGPFPTEQENEVGEYHWPKGP